MEQALEEAMGEAQTGDYNPLDVYIRCHAANQGAIEDLERHDAEYAALATLLQDLVARTQRDVMVPLGPCAFAPGRLVHTNEVRPALPLPPLYPATDPERGVSAPRAPCVQATHPRTVSR